MTRNRKIWAVIYSGFYERRLTSRIEKRKNLEIREIKKDQ